MKHLSMLFVTALTFTALLVASPLLTPSVSAAKAKSSVQTSNGSVSASCSNENDICLNGLPRAGAGAGAVQKIISIVIGVVAAISVMFVAIGGMRYVFSQGDPQAVGKAKSTILYALIGLIICILAQSIVVLVVKAVV